MIDKNFFTTIKILDGGMGQELLSRGLQSKGSLWSASALLEERYNQLVIDAHLSKKNRHMILNIWLDHKNPGQFH